MSATSPHHTPSAPAAAPLRVSVQTDGATCRIGLVGECDIQSTGLLKDTFARAAAGPYVEIVVDLSALTFMDSTGIGLLLGLNRRLARTVGRDLAIVPGPPPVQRVFAICDLLDVLPFEA